VRRRTGSVAWTAGAVGVVLGGALGVVSGGGLCEATAEFECGLEGFVYAGIGLAFGIPVGGFGFAALAAWLQRSGRLRGLMALGAFLGAVLGFFASLLVAFIGSYSLQGGRFVVALVVLAPLFAVAGARMAARSSPR
jgi:hypothetical protein